jgi:hypothetical protein
MRERLKTIGNFLLGALGVLALLLIPAMFIVGAEWLSERLLPWFVVASFLALGLLVLVLLPLAAFRRSRMSAAIAMMYVSYVFGATVWMEGLLLTMGLWGAFAVVIGLFFMGVGVVPIAMLATLLKGMWSPLAELVVLTVLTFGTRFLAAWVAAKSEPASAA